MGESTLKAPSYIYPPNLCSVVAMQFVSNEEFGV